MTKQDQQYDILRLNIKQLIKSESCLTLDKNDEDLLLVSQLDSLLFDQIRMIRGTDTKYIKEIILVEAQKNSKQQDFLTKLLTDGFLYNGIRYVRFGKSSAQGKDGITAFLDENIYNELLIRSQMDVEILECVISKYEAQRCLIFSTCTLIDKELPYIVIIDEYKKIIPNQKIKYVVQEEKEIIDTETKELKTIKQRIIKEGYKDISISPFDGCGCHSKSVSKLLSNALDLKNYTAIGYQIRLPFFKGYTVEFPFKEYYKSIGVETIIDVFGNLHYVDDIDCIWNISMFKAYGIFKKEYGNDGWNKYIETIKKYSYKLGISKYSHHVKDINLKRRMNYQYLQCLDLWNDKYIDSFIKKPREKYDILNPENWGKIIKLSQYSTNLYEKIIKGDKFYTYKFLGMEDTDEHEANGKFVEAVLINDMMLKDAAVKQFLHRKLKKSINQMKYGKIYCDGFYHTVVGDMIGYIEYAAGLDVVGCLKEKEFYCDTISKGKAFSFRSPLVCPSEVNDIKIVENEITQKWCGHFKNQDVVMINMYDLSMPQQGGMDADGDAVFLCNSPIILDSKIEKTMIIDIEDKVAAKSVPYTKENIVKYELNSRDNRIGEITTVASNIENQHTTNEKWIKINDDNVSLLRIMQGKEIDFLKTGFRWHMNKGLRKYAKQIPYFLLYNYPKKLITYYRQKQRIKSGEDTDNHSLIAYRSPSPMNELCDYILNWEKKNIVWDRSVYDTRCLIMNNSLDLNDKNIIKKVKNIITQFAQEWKKTLIAKDNGDNVNLDVFVNGFKDKLKLVVSDDILLANYVIKVSYSNMSTNKSLAWRAYGHTIISNLKSNTPKHKQTKIIEVPYKADNTYEFLGKYYEMIEESDNV